jgi:peptide/nickel transport system substrate-binding protein
MAFEISRRTLIQSAAAGAAALSLPMPFIKRAHAQGRKKMVQAHGEPVTSNWNPTSHTILTQNNVEAYVLGRLYYMQNSPEDPTAIKWDLATGQKVIDEYTVEYTLRNGVTFHDGKKFGAEDVKATLEYVTQPERTVQWYPGRIEAEVIDPLTVRVSTKAGGFPVSALYFRASASPILSKADIDDEKVLSQRLNGTGAWKLLEQAGDTTKFAAFENYHGGHPKLDFIDFPWIADANTRVLGLLSGEFDLTDRLEPEQYETLSKDKRVEVSRTMAGENKIIAFRCALPPTDNPLVRQAISHAIDREQIMQVMGIAGSPSDSFLPSVKFGSDPLKNYPKYDPAKCQELLEKAGYPKGQGMPEIEYVTSSGVFAKTKEYGELIIAMMQEQGIPCRLNVMETSAWLAAAFVKDGVPPTGHMLDHGWNTGSPEPDLFLRPNFYSKVSAVGGLLNGVKDAEIDAAIVKQSNEPVLDKRKDLVVAACELLAEKLPSLSLFTTMSLHGRRAGLNGLYIYPNSDINATTAEFTA